MSIAPDKGQTENELVWLRQEALDHLNKALGILDRIDQHLAAAYVEQARCVLTDGIA